MVSDRPSRPVKSDTTSGNAPVTRDPAVAAATLRAGRLVAFPTETVYGLGASVAHPEAVARIFAAKGRPAGHPLIVHGADAGILDRYGRDVPAAARTLAGRLWPGPLTLVVHRSSAIPDAVTGGRDTVGLRVPDQPLALAMLREAGAGVAAPSANPFGRTSPTTAAHVAADLGDRVDLILDGGPCGVGLESTILDLTTVPPTVLRAGGLPAELLEEALGGAVRRTASGPARAPGMLPAHYAPSARVVVADDPASAVAEALAAGRRVAVLAGTPPAGLPRAVATLVPADPGTEGYARALYDLLRRADALGVQVVVAVPPPAGGLGDAIRDRLRRAAADQAG
ncbi:MAG: threonylcarbamoyl-AMP synthase [Thermoleophilia bacterium]|nr:threonylcarbamoyl-AMP synthase [Thermoleophilia bacterium]